MNLVEQQIEHFVFRADSRVLRCASTGFDAAFSEIAGASCIGARLELATAAGLAPGPALAATAAQHGITHLTIMSSAPAALCPPDLSPVSTPIVAGPRGLADRWAGGLAPQIA